MNKLRPDMLFIAIFFLFAHLSFIHPSQQSKALVPCQNIPTDWLLQAIERNDTESFVKLCNENTVDLDMAIEGENKSTLLMFAVKKGSIDIIEHLVKTGVKLNVANKYGTALIGVIVRKEYSDDDRSKLVRLLVSAGADPLVTEDKNHGVIRTAYGCIAAHQRTGLRLVIEESFEEYEKRELFYKSKVSSEITEVLNGIRDLANICFEYSFTPYMTLPEILHLDVREEYFEIM